MKFKSLTIAVAITGLAVLLTACPSPTPPSTDKTVWLEQNWSEELRHEYHHISQGTLTFGIPVEWFIALEQSALFVLEPKLFSEPDYLASFGFIPSKKSSINEYGLPIGFATDTNAWKLKIGDMPTVVPYSALGVTCAACHTGQMTYKDTSIRYDGGPANINLITFNIKMYIAVFETLLLDDRFERFAKLVLGDKYSPATQKQLHSELRLFVDNLLDEAIRTVEYTLEQDANAAMKGVPTEFNDIRTEIKAIKALKEKPITGTLELVGDTGKLAVNTEKLVKRYYDLFKNRKTELLNLLSNYQEGYARLDALNRIGNTVFSTDANRPDNSVATNAPVNYPHIWTVPWFDWAQYDGSIMQPMVRNAGEALGTNAHLDFGLKDPQKRFESSVPLDNLDHIEEWLAGKNQPLPQKRFDGLQAPKWPENILGQIDKAKSEQGKKLYKELCQSCHLPPMDSDEFWDEKYWMNANAYGAQKTDLKVLKLAVYPLDTIGTDPGQASILPTRTVDITGLGIDKTTVYFQAASGQQCIPVNPLHGTDNNPQKALFALALGAVVQETTKYWYDKHNTPEEQRFKMDGERSNCLRAPKGYRVRPLNGIWATAPFLHNGSVPTLYDLLSPVAERPKEFYLGNLEFDPENVGYVSKKGDGFSKVNTSIPGSFNTGHEFNNGENTGIIGRLLSQEERRALVEYLKTL